MSGNLGFFVLVLTSGLLVSTGSFKDPVNADIKKANSIHRQIQDNRLEKEVPEVRIGLMIPESPDNNIMAGSAVQGAELAIKIANEEGGYRGKPFKLVVRTAEGLWGAGSKESVKLVHEDEVWAIVTALDGRNSHLTEQVAAKSHVVQIETRASEESLSQAFVPWFFRIVPNDKQQSKALIREINSREYKNVYVIHEKNFDDEKAAQSFRKQAEIHDISILGNHVIDPEQSDLSIPDIVKNADVVVYFGGFDPVVMDRIKRSSPQVIIFGPLSVTADGSIGKKYSDGAESGVFVSSRFCFTTPGQEFKNMYKATYGMMPNPASSYAFDGINLIIESINKAGLDRQKIRDTLADISYVSGATGPIKFDEYGNRESPVFMIRIIKGHPVLLN